MPEYVATINLVARDQTGQTVNSVGQKVQQLGKGATLTVTAEDKASSVLDKIKGGIGTLAKVAAGAGVGFTAGIAAFATAGIGAARQVDNLDASLRGLAQANNLSVEGLYQQVEGIQALDIDAASARKAVAQFAQNNLDLSKSTDLVRTAQDASVISGQNTAETLDDLIHGITTLQPEMFRASVGVIDANTAYAAYAKTLGKNAKELSGTEKQQALMNAVLEQGGRIAGIAKQAQDPIAALPVAVKNLATAFGMELLPAIKPAAEELFQFLKGLATSDDLKVFAQATGQIIAALIGGIVRLLPFVFNLARGFIGILGPAIATVAPIIQGIVDFVSALFEAFTGDTGALGVVYDLIMQAFGPEVAALFQPLLQNLMDFLNGTDQLRGPLGAIKGLFDAVGATIAFVTGIFEGIGNVVVAVTGFFQRHTWAMSILVGVLTAVVGILTLLNLQVAIATAVQAAQLIPLMLWIAQMYIAAAATSAWAAVQAILNAVLTANPIGLIVVALAALAAGLIYAYNNSETFRNAVNALWSGIVAFVQGAITAIQQLWSTWGPIAGLIIAVFFGPIGIAAYALMSNLDTVFAWMRGALETVRKAWADSGGNIVSFVTTLGSQIIQGLISGMQSVASGMGDWIKTNITDKIPGFIKQFLGISSPSSVMAGLGVNIMQGLLNGLSSKLPDLQNWLSNKLGGLLGAGAGGAMGGDVTGWIAQAIAATGVPASWASGLAIIIQHESGGNPAAANNWDINAIAGDTSVGLMQLTGSNRAAYTPAGLNPLDPVAQIIAGINYIRSRYGDISRVPGVVSVSQGGAYRPYQQGGWLREPVAGIGLNSGARYSLAEAWPEYVMPGGGGGGGAGLTIGSVSVTVNGAAGPAQAWSDAADGIFDELYARLSRAMANRPLGAGRGAF